MLIQSLEQKTRLALTTVLLTIIGSTVICACCIFYCAKLVTEERNQIYVLDGDIPFLAERSKQEANFVMEAKAHIQLFHQYFFNLPPDDDYIKWTLAKGNVYGRRYGTESRNRRWRKNGFLLGHHLFLSRVYDHLRLHPTGRAVEEVQILWHADYKTPFKGYETLPYYGGQYRECAPYKEQSSWLVDYQLEDTGE